MTAEVALLNNAAVALAADSAMTLRSSGKTYSVQKLFALSKEHAVGVMVYNNSEFMGIPWETLINMYREVLDDEPRPTVERYLDEFLSFIVHKRFKTRNHEFANVLHMADAPFREVARNALEHPNGTNALGEEIRKAREWLQNAESTKSLTNKQVSNFLSSYRDQFNESIEQAFGEFELTARTKRSLFGLLRDLLKSDVPTPNHSGLVIAGFGSEEFFPTLIAVTIEGTVGGKLKFDRRQKIDISRDGQSASIVPFAQHEMVQRFMAGVDPAFLRYLGDTMGEASTQLVIEALKGFDIECSEAQEDAVRRAALQQTAHYLREAEEFQEIEFVNPIMEIVQHLPKQELADMAEALVNLTALKRRVSLEAESVGGPTDVAVISKGDGLVWIRRKQYFDREIN